MDQYSHQKATGHAKALFDLWSDTLSIQNYGGLIQKSFGVEIDPKEVESLKQYSASIRSLISS